MGFSIRARKAAEFALPTSLRADSGSVLALKFFGHDASIAVAKGGRIQCVLELERLFEIRYFSPSADSDDPAYTWFSALELVQKKCECEDGICPTSFDHGVLVNFGTRLGARWQVNFPKLVEEVFPVREWRNVNHHEAHAMLGYFASPFRSAFILSYDGGANDGVFNAFVARGLHLYRIARQPLNLAVAYHTLASYLPEVTGMNTTPVACNRVLELTEGDWIPLRIWYEHTQMLSFAGKLMGYSGLAQPSPELGPWIQKYYERWAHGQNDVPRAFLEKVCAWIWILLEFAITYKYSFENLFGN